MSIDWDKFAARVPAGTAIGIAYCIWIDNPYSRAPQFKNILGWDGILLRHGRETYGNKTGAVKWVDSAYVQLFQVTRPMGIHPANLKYLINGQWLTFEEVMA